MSQYAWRSNGWRPPKSLDPQVVGEELERIAAQRGVITADIVVEEARNPASPLHVAVFHVDAERAAELHFLERARLIVRSLFVISEVPTAPIVRAFQFVVAEDGSRQYMAAADVALDPALREQIRQRLVLKMAALRSELASWEEFSHVVEALNEALAS